MIKNKKWIIGKNAAMAMVGIAIIIIIVLTFYLTKSSNNLDITNQSFSNSRITVLQKDFDLSPEETKAMAMRSVDRLLTQYDQNYAKNIGALPDSPYYSIKRSQENGNLLLKTKDKKTVYLAELSIKRLIEAYLMLKKGNTDKFEAALGDYMENLEKLKEVDNDAILRDLVWDLEILNRLSLVVADNSKNFSKALQKTMEFQSGKIPKAIIKETK